MLSSSHITFIPKLVWMLACPSLLDGGRDKLPDYKKRRSGERVVPNHYFHFPPYSYFHLFLSLFFTIFLLLFPSLVLSLQMKEIQIHIIFSQMYLINKRNTDSQHFSQMYLTNERNTDLTNERNTDSQHFEHLRHPPEEIIPILVVPYFLTLVHFKCIFLFDK